jgi:hypothetical protein
MAPRQAAALVEARLGRPAQDALEATVALEAWGGIRPTAALPLGDALIGERPGRLAGRCRDRAIATEAWRWSEHVAMIVALLALVLWSGPLIAAVGADTFELTWRLAIPLTLTFQWAIRRRYLAGPEGLGRLRRGSGWLATTTAGTSLGLVAVAGLAGGLASLLVTLWIAAMVVGRRGWGLAYAAGLVTVAVALWAQLPALATMLVATGVSVLAVAVALVTVARSIAMPGPLRQTLLAGALGGTLGLVLVLDGSFRWEVAGVLPALVLLPSVVGGVYGGAHLSTLWKTLPTTLRMTPASRQRSRASTASTAGVLGGALVRTVAVVALLSVFVAIGPWAAAVVASELWWVLVGFGAIAVGALTITLHDAFGRSGWAFAAALAGLGGQVAVHLAVPAAPTGAGLFVAAVTIVAVLLAPTAALVHDPARTFATVVNVR